jgi:proteasome accessory factor B
MFDTASGAYAPAPEVHVTAKTERLVNLTVALLSSRRPLTFAELRSKMGEWQDGEFASMRRKFERDKDELRGLGVPIDTVERDGEVAYVIDDDAYALPEVELTAQQMTVLAVAFQLVDGGADQLTFSRVAALAPDPHETDAPSGITVHAVEVDPVRPLATALVDGRVVRFRHRKPDGTETDREVEPRAMLARRGTWYLRGHDRTRDDARVFRTDRIVGEVELTDEVVDLPADGDDAAELASLFDLPDEVDVTVLVREGEEWIREERRDRRFRATSRALQAVPNEVLVEPTDARDAVVDGLRAVLAAHGQRPGEQP